MEQTEGHPEKYPRSGMEHESKHFISIQAYTGKEYQLYDANEKVSEVAENNADDIIDAVKHFFQDTYYVQVKIHNMVSAKDGVTVFVESVHEPYFHTYVIVPIHVIQKKIKLNRIWSQEGEVERAIKGGLYVMAFNTEFFALDRYLERITDELPVTGTPRKVIDKVTANGYTTPYYFISPGGKAFNQVYKIFMDNPYMTKDEIRTLFKNNIPEPKHINIGIEFYMRDKDASPTYKIMNTIITDIQKMTDIPRGAYSFYLNDNQIDKIRGNGKKANTLEKSTPDKIIKI